MTYIWSATGSAAGHVVCNHVVLLRTNQVKQILELGDRKMHTDKMVTIVMSYPRWDCNGLHSLMITKVMSTDTKIRSRFWPGILIE